jgi:chromate transport protein ChrA
MNLVNALFNSLSGAHSSAALGQAVTALAATAVVRAIWRHAIRRLARIFTTTAVVGVAILLFCHPRAFEIPVTPLGPTNSPISHQP